MRKIILELAVSVDGYIEGPKGEYDWCFTDQDYGLNEFVKRVDSLFMGRKSYELVQKDPLPWKGFTNYVFTTSLENPAEDNVKLVRSMDEVPSIVKQPGKDIWLFGGAHLVTQFLNADLIDEIRMSVHPIILGGGKLLFQDINQRKTLKLIEAKTYDSGLVQLRYSKP